MWRLGESRGEQVTHGPFLLKSPVVISKCPFSQSDEQRPRTYIRHYSLCYYMCNNVGSSLLLRLSFFNKRLVYMGAKANGFIGEQDKKEFTLWPILGRIPFARSNYLVCFKGAFSRISHWLKLQKTPNPDNLEARSRLNLQGLVDIGSLTYLF